MTFGRLRLKLKRKKYLSYTRKWEREVVILLVIGREVTNWELKQKPEEI